MAADLLFRALHDPGDGWAISPLPDGVAALLTELAAPPRLAAHLRLVHDVAVQLLDWLRSECPQLTVDEAAVRFGAATHDIGKTLHPEELSGPGSQHEPAGYRLLLGRGAAERLARFADTHARWDRPAATMEELLVSLADKVWKGKRVPGLEDAIVGRLAAATGREPWEMFTALDDAVAVIVARADERLAFQARYPVVGA